MMITVYVTFVNTSLIALSTNTVIWTRLSWSHSEYR